MSIDVEAVFKVVAYGVPALLVLGGIILLLIGYPTDYGPMISGGWVLVLLGVIIYLIELIFAYVGNR